MSHVAWYPPYFHPNSRACPCATALLRPCPLTCLVQAISKQLIAVEYEKKKEAGATWDQLIESHETSGENARRRIKKMTGKVVRAVFDGKPTQEAYSAVKRLLTEKLRFKRGNIKRAKQLADNRTFSSPKRVFSSLSNDEDEEDIPDRSSRRHSGPPSRSDSGGSSRASSSRASPSWSRVSSSRASASRASSSSSWRPSNSGDL